MSQIEYPAGERGAIDPDAGRSLTLPSRYYHDPAIHARELEAVFYRGWCYVGPAAAFARAGDYRIERIADQCIVVLRAGDSNLQAYFNVCQHRGHELLAGTGNTGQRIVCPYHAWVYGLDGHLLRAPHTERMRDFDATGYGLRPVRLANCAGLLFANLDPDAAPFEQEYPGLEQTLVESLPDIDGYDVAAGFEYDIAANWKVVVDNFSEGYHIPVAHPELSRLLDSRGGNRARVERRYAFFESRSQAGFAGLAVAPGSPYRSWTLWPNTCMLSLPGCANLIVIRMAENGPERCREHVDLLTPGGARSPELDAVERLFAAEFNAEDIAIVESVQRGLKSLGYDQGRYVADDTDAWYSEAGLHRFHLQLLQALAQL